MMDGVFSVIFWLKLLCSTILAQKSKHLVDRIVGLQRMLWRCGGHEKKFCLSILIAS